MIHRRRISGTRCEGVALILACCLLLGIAGCQGRRCVVDPPDRAVEAAAPLAADLQQRVADALSEPGAATLQVHEGALTALLRQVLPASAAHSLTLHITEEAVYLQAAVARERVPIRMRFIPTAVDGYLAVRITCLTVDRHTMPRIACAAIESAVMALVADAARSLHIDGITLRDESLTVTVSSVASAGG